MDSSARTTRGMLLDFFLKNLKLASFDHFKNIAAKKCFPVFCQSFEPCLSSTQCEIDMRDELCNSDAHYQRKSSNLTTFFEKIRAHTKLSPLTPAICSFVHLSIFDTEFLHMSKFFCWHFFSPSSHCTAFSKK